jgi:hypothetical protein
LYEAFLSYLLNCNSQRDRVVNDQYDLDAIISLNYDTVIENALGAFEGAHVYYGDEILGQLSESDVDTMWKEKVLLRLSQSCLRTTLPLLKLHGSVNWSCRDPDRGASNAGTRGKEDYLFEEVRQLWDPHSDDSKNKDSGWFDDVPLVPPTWKKQSSEISIFACMVEYAIRHLSRAAKIVVIGYSMPESDAHFRYMLAKSLCTPEFPNIEVWDVRPSNEFQTRLERMFGSHNLRENRVVYSDGGLRGFVDSRAHESSVRIA